MMFDSSVFLVTEIELKKLQSMQKVVEDAEKNDSSFTDELAGRLYEYIMKSKADYKYIGQVQFDFRL